MENSERIKKWKEERAKVAEESRASRLQQKENERSLRQTEKTADAKSHHRPDAGWSATDADSVRRASLVIKERRVQQAKQSLRRLFLYIALPLLVIMLMSWLLTSRFYSADATFIVQTDASQDNFSGTAFFGAGNEMSEGFQVREFILSKEMMERMEKELGFYLISRKTISHYFPATTRRWVLMMILIVTIYRKSRLLSIFNRACCV